MSLQEYDSVDEYDLDNESGPSATSTSQPGDSEGEYSLDDDDPEEPQELDDEETQEEEEEEEENKKPPHPLAWKLMLGMMINPVQGWKNIRRADMSVDDVARECFYPLTGGAAVSCFLEVMWKHGISLNQATINALKVFVAFFFGNFLTLLLIKGLFPSNLKSIADTDFGKKFVMYNLSTLALFYILYGCFPMVGPILVFLPIWTIYLVLRGSRFFMFPEAKGSLLRTLLSIFIVGTPIAVYWVMDLFI